MQCATYYSTCRRSVRQEDPACRCRGPQGAMVLLLQQHIVTLSSASGAFIVPPWRYTLVTNKHYHKIVLLLLSVVEESVVVRNGSTMVMVRWWVMCRVGLLFSTQVENLHSNFTLGNDVEKFPLRFAQMEINLHKWKLICICANQFPPGGNWNAFVQIDLHLCKLISTQRTRHFLNPTHVPLQTQRLWVPFRVLNGCQLSRNIAKYCQRDLCHTWLSHWTCHIRDLAVVREIGEAAVSCCELREVFCTSSYTCTPNVI